MIIRPFRVHIAMANFSPVFKHENQLLNYWKGLIYDIEDMQR